MTYGNPTGSDLSGYLGKEGIAQFPGSFLQGAVPGSPVGSHVLVLNSDGKAQRPSQFGYILNISLGFGSSKLMVEMSHVKSDP
jgi:hypothetical protein